MTRPFSPVYKAKMVQRLTGPNAISAVQLAKETGLRQQTLSHWLRDARTLPDVPKKPTAKKAAKTVEDKARIVSEAGKLDGDELMAYLEREGVKLAELEQWRLALAEEGRASKATTDQIRALQKRLVDDLLDISRLIMGKVSLECEAVNLANILRSAVENVALEAESKGVRVEERIVSDCRDVIASVDTARIQQVFGNLLSNAIRFTPPEGKVKIVLTKCNESATIEGTDEGVGIEPSELPFIFDRFWQSPRSDSQSRVARGLGLGLAIVRQLIELHGGSVSAHSEGLGLARLSRLRCRSRTDGWYKLNRRTTVRLLDRVRVAAAANRVKRIHREIGRRTVTHSPPFGRELTRRGNAVPTSRAKLDRHVCILHRRLHSTIWCLQRGLMEASLATRVSQPGRLELVKSGTEAFHVLNDTRINQGDILELQLAGGRWLRGRYEWSGQLARWPAFRVDLGGPWEFEPHQGPIPAAALALHPEAIVRRPID